MSLSQISVVKNLLIEMGLNTYQASVLTVLLHLGESKATILSKVSNVPSARIYDVLDELVKMGLVKVRPGRPALYSPVSPEDIASSIVSWNLEEMRRRIKVIEDLGKRFVEAASKIYLKGRRGLVRRPLIRIVSVGDVSEEETRKLYNDAREEILIFSQAFEYFPRVSKELLDAVERRVRVKVILKNPEKMEEDKGIVQRKILSLIKKRLGDRVELRFADDVPLRGCIIDPETDGKAIFLVEEVGVPFEFREAALTSNPGLVRALSLMFNLLWSNSRVLEF